MTALIIGLGALLGAVIGSFLTCAVWRLPRRVKLNGRSVCPTCRTQLKNRWNIPVFGWLVLRGRAGCCGTRIPARYPLIEIASAFVGVGAALTASQAFGPVAGLACTWGLVLVVTLLCAVASAATARHEADDLAAG